MISLFRLIIRQQWNQSYFIHGKKAIKTRWQTLNIMTTAANSQWLLIENKRVELRQALVQHGQLGHLRKLVIFLLSLLIMKLSY